MGRHLGVLIFATLATRINAQLFVLLAREGTTMAVSMLLLTALLECASLSNVRHLRSLAGGKSLYLQAWWRNVYNALLLGVPIYVSVCSWPNFFIRRGDDWSVGTVDALEVAVVVLLHSLWYYLSHTAFHKVPGLFFVHKFHRRFRGKSVSPSTALAVSPLEFIFAFDPGLVLLKPSRATLQASLVVVMGHNLLMHFPPVEEAPGGCLASLSARRTTCTCTCRTTGTQATSFRATRCRTTTLASSCS